MRHFLIGIFILLGVGLTHPLSAQRYGQDTIIDIASIQFTYNGMIPFQDMGERFGYTSAVGVDVSYKFSKKNLYATVAAYGIFGGIVKEDSVIDALKTTTGFLIADDGTLVEGRLQESGLMIPISFGKIFSLRPEQNANSGLYIEVGGQYIQHKIRIDAIGAQVAALSKENKKGYDRLTSGIGIREGIGYRYYSRNSLVNFSLGLNFSQNFTKSRRSIFVDTGQTEFSTRKDFLVGFNFGWMILLYRGETKRFYYR